MMDSTLELELSTQLLTTGKPESLVLSQLWCYLLYLKLSKFCQRLF